jgi:hypothetical protein
MAIGNNIFKNIIVVAYLFSLVLTGIDAYKHPAYNGDIYSYSKIVLSIDHGYTNQTLAIRDSILEKEIPAERFKVLTKNRDNGKIASRDINKGVSFAVIKPLYIGVAYAAYKSGMQLTKATVLPSMLAYIAMGILLIFWLLRYLSILPAFIISFVAVKWKIIVKIAAMSSPDALSCFFLFWSLYYLIEQKSFWHFYSILILSVLTRIDNGMFGVFIIILLLFIKDNSLRISFKTSLVALVGLLGTYIIMMYVASFYGRNMLFFSSYFEDQHVGSERMFEPNVYIETLKSTVDEAINKTKGLKFLALGILLLVYKKGKWTIDQWVAAIFVLLFIIRTLLFPHTTDRFYIGFYFVFVILFVRVYVAFVDRYFPKTETIQ